jgi:phenylacetic acid degradation operon negative regulatory protein
VGTLGTVNDQLRRRSVGAPAARSVLLTMMGEYVISTPDGVWQETLISALGTLGHRTQAARQALARSVKAGWLVTERHGRRSRVRLSDETAEILRTGAERIYSFGDPWEWDGHWLLVTLRVPEERREVRHRMRTQLAWAGFGSLGGGVWISPHVERESELRQMADGSVADLLSFRAELGSIGDPGRVISEAWDLDAVAGAYREFISAFGRLRPKTPEAVFRVQTLLVHAWRKFPFLDPDLPENMLPPGWPRSRAHDVFHDRHASWHETAQDYFRSLEAADRASGSSKSSRTASKYELQA